MERARVLMYSKQTTAYLMGSAFNNDYTETIHVSRFSDIVNCILNINFDLILLDSAYLVEYEQITNLLSSKNIEVKIIVISILESPDGSIAYYPIQFPDEIQKQRENDERAGIKHEAIIDVDDKLIINPNSRQVIFGNTEIRLTKTEFDLFYCFAKHRDKVLSYDQILACVWGYDNIVGDDIVKAHLRRLRKKLAFTGREYIKNVRGKGYILS